MHREEHWAIVVIWTTDDDGAAMSCDRLRRLKNLSSSPLLQLRLAGAA